ncbi:MAG: DNA/RNA non-specific endonuclease [Bacteroidetes bacterium]|nr:DNA/RNA non-specific endonuclease [Bacteroidota bacterium]
MYNQIILKSGAELKSEIKERNKLYALRETRRDFDAIKVLATERMIGGADESKDVAPNENAKKHGIPVARLYEIGAELEPKGFGTGFLVAPNVLITNNHVFQTLADAFNCAANFLYERKEGSSIIQEGISYRLRPDIFFYTYVDLDFSLVYVEEIPIYGNRYLKTLDMLSLIETKGKIKLNSPINIIQYPKGSVKKYTTEDNLVTNIDDASGIIYYTTDTAVGSSGSPCFNKYWEVAALHYTGIPKTNSSGKWLAKNGEVWNPKTMGEEDVDWIANAGKSISKIVEHLRKGGFKINEKKYVEKILKNSFDPLKNVTEINQNPIHGLNNNSNMNTINMNFNANTNVYINNNNLSNDQNKLVDDIQIKNDDALLEKKERFDEDYDNREGYNEEFLNGFKVPLPTVSKEREHELYKNIESSVPYIVPYHHFSLVMNKTRRMLMWAASNVNYDPKFRDNRERADFGNGAWRLDKRIPAIYQIQAAEFYDPATLVDKGHIVRRDDNCWAELKNNETNSLGIEYANADTFHWTNCTPQHEAFNRDTAQYAGIGLWGVLENAIKEQLELPDNDSENSNKDYCQKACVLAGPILNENDPEYCDIQYPLRFWKVFAIKSKSAGNLVFGFILSQEDKIEKTGLEKEGIPRFDRKVKALQVSLKTIEDESGVIFDQSLHDVDVFLNIANVELKNNLENMKRINKI